MAQSLLGWTNFFLLVLGLMVVPALPLAASGEQAYTVRRGDTLFGIAQKTGVAMPRLADRNGLDKTHQLRVGQRLIIPAVSASKPLPRHNKRSSLPTSVQRAIDRATVRPGRWKYVVIHHSGVDSGTVEGMDRYHRRVRHMENGLAYHFVIGNGSGFPDGKIAVGQRWTKQLDGGHLISEDQNRVSLGICLIGNFERNHPTAKQMQQLTALTQALLGRCRLSPGDIRTHTQINIVHTRCPGRNFPTDSFLKSLQNR